jgi:hypothetical protein
MAISGEPATPSEPAHGVVWKSIVEFVDRVGAENKFVSSGDVPRSLLSTHPWSLQGGGASQLKARIEELRKLLRERVIATGRTVVVGDDDAWILDRATARRRSLKTFVLPFVIGEDIRDWAANTSVYVVYPYEEVGGEPLHSLTGPLLRFLWPNRTLLANRTMFGKTIGEHGKHWWEHLEHYGDRLRNARRISYAFVATHNHFVLGDDARVFNRSAPVLCFACNAEPKDVLSTLAILNSSVACFWMKQVSHCAGSTVDQHGARQRTAPFEDFFQFNSSQLEEMRIPDADMSGISQRLVNCLRQCVEASPSSVDAASHVGDPDSYRAARRRMVFLQEEIDWACYRHFGLAGATTMDTEESREVELGQRAFEIVMARRMAMGELESTWFERHGSTPITDLPADWPDDYKRLVERRIELIETDRNLGLIEQPEYKRRWNTEPWELQLERALREWLLDRLESYFDFDGRMNEQGTPTSRLDIALTTVSRLADVARQDADFMQVGEVYRDDRAFSVDRLVAELVEAESVPLLPILRYKPSGLRKRTEWEQTWALQREEDRTGKRLDIPVPPKYTSAEFLKSDYWRLRGKLDVTKERWVSFPHCEGPDGTLVIAWAGNDHLQLARSISSYFVDIQERLGGRNDPRLVPLLACLLELIPWLKQWHNEVDAEFGERMGDYFEGFVNEEARQLGKTIPEIKAWEPPKKAGGRKKK